MYGVTLLIWRLTDVEDLLSVSIHVGKAGPRFSKGSAAVIAGCWDASCLLGSSRHEVWDTGPHGDAVPCNQSWGSQCS